MLARGEWATATACTILLMIAIAFSGSMALSAALGSRLDAASVKGSVDQDRSRLQSAYDAATNELAGLAPTRTIGELRAAIDAGSGVDATIWTRTAKCTAVTLPASKVACQPFTDLSAELGRAQRRQELESAIKDASAKLTTLPPPRVADATVVAVQRVLGLVNMAVDPSAVQTGAALLFVLLLELGSALGLVVAESLAAPEPQGRPLAVKGPEAAPQVVPAAGEAPCETAEPLQPRGSRPAAAVQPRLQGGYTAATSPAASQAASQAAGEPQRGLAALVRVLEGLGGVYCGSQSELARLMGCPRTAAQQTLNAAATHLRSAARYAGSLIYHVHDTPKTTPSGPTRPQGHIVHAAH